MTPKHWSTWGAFFIPVIILIAGLAVGLASYITVVSDSPPTPAIMKEKFYGVTRTHTKGQPKKEILRVKTALAGLRDFLTDQPEALWIEIVEYTLSLTNTKAERRDLRVILLMLQHQLKRAQVGEDWQARNVLILAAVDGAQQAVKDSLEGLKHGERPVPSMEQGR